MASNEPSISGKGEGGFERLLGAMEGGIDQLGEAIEHGDADQLEHWHSLLSEISIDELLEAQANGQLSREELNGLFRAVHLLMQWEHTQAEELKIVERETTEMARREESWANEREALRAELSTLRERITARVGVDNVHEAFRAEIDALAAENAQLKQLGRDRDRELTEQRDRADELEGRLQGAERERALMVGNQTQLEETIRELNRRMSTRSEASQRGQEWESRKLRQRNEQALVLSEQVRELAAQNDDLQAEVGRLTKALEEATQLIGENARKFMEFDEQFGEAEKQIEVLGRDNRELRQMLAEREEELKRRTDGVELRNREIGEMLQEKEAQMEGMRSQMQRANLNLDQLRAELEAAQPDQEREEELKRLRLELMAATESARRLFGEEMEAEMEGERKGIAARMGRPGPEASAELRLRMVQMDGELERAEAELEEERRRAKEMEAAVEGKDMQIARLLADCQRYRQIAFGDSEAEMRRIERQLEYRERQIGNLQRKCGELQFEVEKMDEERRGRKGKDEDEGAKEEEEKETEEEEEEGIRPLKRKKIVAIREEEEEEIVEEMEEKGREEEEGEYRIERIDEAEEEWKEKGKIMMMAKKEEEEAESSWPRISRKELVEELARGNVLNAEMARLIHELEGKKEEMANMEKLYGERGRHLMVAKEAETKAKRELAQMKEMLFFGDDGEFFEKMDEDGGDAGAGGDPFAMIRHRERLEALELGNMELRRLADNLAQSGDERERRMAEGTRRLLYLAVREAKLERRVQIGQRLRKAMVEELDATRKRLNRVMTGEEARSRQLGLENEAKLFELARLQNALLHSVPIGEYRRVLRQNKKLLRDRFLADSGYQSATEGEEGEEEVDRMDISRAGLLFGPSSPDSPNALLVKCRRLQELNDVLSGQNESMRNERRKMEAELAELNAFLDDLEGETEMKSMLANIERRFLQTLREQFDGAEERESLQRELGRMERNSREAGNEWLAERQSLVQLISRLHSTLQRVVRESVQRVPISMAQLEVLAKKMREMREKEAELSKKEEELEGKEEEIGRREKGMEARKEAMARMVANDWQMEHMEASLQGYQLNVLTLQAELGRTRKKLEKAEKEARELREELEEMRQSAGEFQFILGMDLKLLEGKLANLQVEEEDGKEDMEEGEKGKRGGEEERGPMPWKMVAEEGRRKERGRTKVIVLNNSAEWEGQLKQVREQAKLCVESYKEQLERKEKTLEEYRALLEQLKAELRSSTTRGGPEAKMQTKETRGEEEERGRPKSSEELLGEEERKEEWERRIRRMESGMRMLERENAELETERMELVEAMRRRREEGGKERRNVLVQVDIGGRREGEKKKGREGMEENGGEGKRRRKEDGEGERKRRREGEQEAEEEGGRMMKEEEDGAEEKESESGSSTEGEMKEEDGPGSGGSDSGTVDDIERANGGGARRGPSNRRPSSAGDLSRSKGGSAGTRTIPIRPPASGGHQRGEEAKEDGMEMMVLRHRNETRRLRMRIMELERRNKELTEQYASLRERARVATRPRSSTINSGTSADDAIRKENERLQRQNANLSKSIEAKNQEMEEMGKRLRRVETRSKTAGELWEERKKHEQAMAGMRKKLGEAEGRERDLRERLERRERHIEQMGRERQGGGGWAADGERLNAALRQWREEKAELEKRAKMMEEEKRVLATRNGELMARLETLARENKSARKRLELAQQRERNMADQLVEASKGGQERKRKKEEEAEDAQTQTMEEEAQMSTRGDGDPSRSIVLPTARPSLPAKNQMGSQMSGKEERGEMEWEEARKERGWREENQTLVKRLKRAELLQEETAEQLEALRRAHGQLLEDYNGLARLGKEMELRRSSRDEDETMGLALLRDKLGARERELELQRRRILDLERQIWQTEMKRRQN